MLVCSTLARRLARRVSPPLLGGLVATAALLGGVAAQAATLTVTDTSDVATDTGSLRHAVNTALPGDTITFAPGVTGVITLSPANGSLAFNSASGSTPITLSGPGANALAIDGGQSSAVFTVYGVAVSIKGLTVQNGMAAPSAYGGGGIDVEHGGALTLTACTVAGNTAPNYENGGGLYVARGSSAALTACTFSGNTGYEGGGVFDAGTATLSDCTVAGNAANLSGGGVYAAFNNAACTLASSTVTGNAAYSTGGGLDVADGAVAGITGSIVAGNSAFYSPDVAVDASTDPGKLTSGGYSLIGIGDGGSGYAGTDLKGTASAPANPRLDPEGLKMNGGPTPTIAPLPGSPVLDAVPASLAPATDQRGAPRNASDGKADAGAFEAQTNDSITDLTASANPALQGQNVTFTARVYAFAGTPTGSVKFATGGQTATVTLSASGTAALTTNALSLGYHAVMAAYSGDVHFRAGQSAALNEHILYASKALKVTDKTDNANDPGSIRSIVNNSQAGTSVTFPNLSGTITLTNGPLVIGQDLTLTGPGAGSLTIDGNKNGSVLVITGGNVSLSGLTFQNGKTTGYGGGIAQEAGTLTLTNCVLTANTAFDGGGLYAGGTATLSGCSVTNNAGTIAGGGISADNAITLTGCVLSGNSAPGSQFEGGFGGAIYCRDAVTLSGCGLTKNAATGPGGGVYCFAALTATACTVQGNTAGQAGGGLNSADAVNLAYSLVSGNTAQTDGGGVYASGQLTASYSAVLGNSAAGMGGGGGIYVQDTYDTAALTGCTLSGDTAPAGNGGGLFTSGPATLTNCILSGDTSTGGGGLYTGSYSGLVTLTGCTLAGDTATGIYGYGGGLYASGPLTLSGSTLSGGTASMGGGGLYCSDQTLVTDCTIANNAAQGDSGGGLYDDGFLTLTACTLTGNTDPKFSGGGLYVDYLTNYQVTAALQTDLIAGNTAGTDPDVAVSTSFASTDSDAPVVTSNGYNLIGIGGLSYAASGPGDMTGTAAAPINPRLDPNGLQYNGGPTQTVALMTGSPALDKVPAKAAQAADQRGAPRPGNNDGKADIGAYEAQLKNSGKAH